MSKLPSYETAVKAVPEGFTDTINGSSADDLRKIIVDAQKSLRQLSDTESTDEQLKAAREMVKDLGKGYKDARSAYLAKVVVALQRLEEVGG